MIVKNSITGETLYDIEDIQGMQKYSRNFILRKIRCGKYIEITPERIIIPSRKKERSQTPG